MRTFSLVLAGLVGFALVGCGGGKSGGIRAEGKVVKGGAPVTIGDGETLTITLKSDAGKTYTTNASPEGTFSVQEPAGGGIAAGTYKVSYVHQRSDDPYTKKPAFKTTKDNVETWDLTSSNTSLVLDIGK